MLFAAAKGLRTKRVSLVGHIFPPLQLLKLPKQRMMPEMTTTTMTMRRCGALAKREMMVVMTSKG